MKAQDLVCWKCGAALKELPLPLARLAECPACRAELHVCRQCEFYEARVADQCTEDRAEAVKEKERANFCDWFRPRPQAYVARDESRSDAARRQLDTLFGAPPSGTANESSPARRALDDIFSEPKKKD